MKMKERHAKIIELITDQKKMSVIELSDIMGVSQVTIRKDLDFLSETGIIVREHGYATLNSHDDINNRLAYHFSIKEKIVSKVIESIHDGETIMIESGSCCALLAYQLSQLKKDITIITNSAFISDYVRKSDNVDIILLGGNYQKEAQVNVGPMIKACTTNIYVDKFFIGADGFSKKSGFTGNDLLRAEAVRTMAEHANEVIVITESNKFNEVGLVKLLPTEEIKKVYTDSNIPSASESYLESIGVQVIKAEC